jgi:hydroxymethylpyrimidine/phosphomethylpyrimidine kinase
VNVLNPKVYAGSTMQTVLTIAGYDPSSGAGVTADLMVFAAHGLFGTSCMTSLTVQSTMGVRSATPVAADMVRATLDCLESDLPAAGIKIGMLGTAGNAAAVVEFLQRLRDGGRRVPVVLDPVLRSSSGRELLDADGVAVMQERLLPLVDWVTPNLEEAGVLTGRSVKRREDMLDAARVLQAMGERLNIASRSTHGTGCAFSSALLSRIVLGDEVKDAVLLAKQYVAEAIRTAVPMGEGLGPVNHLWPLQED